MAEDRRLKIEESAEVNNLRLLVWLRWCAIVGICTAVASGMLYFGIRLPVGEISALLAALAVINLFAIVRWHRLGWALRRVVVTDLLADVVVLALILYLTGGAENPFTGLFILQAIVAAALLPTIEALVVVVATIAAQVWLLQGGWPLALPMIIDPDTGRMFNLHLQGMVLSFIVTSLLAMLFIVGLRANLRRRDAQIAALNAQIEEEHTILRLGLMAAKAAHDLSTPLTRIAVMLEDWAEFGPPQADRLPAELTQMQEAIATCRARITAMLAMAGHQRLEEAQAEDPAALLARVLSDTATGPSELDVTVTDRRRRPSRMLSDVLIEGALVNLLANAREAEARQVAVTLDEEDRSLVIRLADDGPGFPAPMLADQGVASGGVGLLLVRAALRRVGGSMALANRAEGNGAVVTLKMPLVAADA